jgi:asparagine synthetase B (glutamine-hydrolysing)
MIDEAGWVLALSWDEQGRARMEGVRAIRRGDLSAFVSGVLYDAADWTRELRMPAATPPTEIVLETFTRYGPDVASRFRGSFVCAALDHGTNEVRVVRDPLGSHPLFYTSVGSRVLFASTPQPLLRQPGVSRDLNRAALADHLCRRWPLREETFFEAIRRVPPGWMMRATATELQGSRYWNPVGGEIEWLSDVESDRFDEVLDRAVDRGLDCGPSGVFLSGGFDSVSVAAVAADRARKRGRDTPLALSLGFPDPDSNEQPIQRAVADRLGLPMHMVAFQEAVGPRGLLALALEMNEDLAAPGFNTWTPAYAALLRYATSHGVHTIFTGEGGDEWLGVTPFLAADLLRQLRLREVLQLALTTKRSYQLGWPAVIKSTVWRHGLRPIAGMWAHRMARDRWDRRRAHRVQASTPSWVAPHSTIREIQFNRALSSVADADPKGGFYGRESRLFLDHPLTSWIFEEQFQLGGRMGVRYLHPYWDPDVLTLAYRTRPDRLNKGGISKGLVRQTVASRFPQLGFERQRKVTAVRFFADMVRKECPPEALGALNIVDPAGARAFLCNAWTASPQELGRAWNLINLESWTRRQLH